MIDWERVAELREEVGAEAFGEVVALFLEETDAVIATLARSTDDEEIRASLHFVKGSALNLGFAKVAELCRSHADDPPDLHRLGEIYRASRAELLSAALP